MKPTELKIALMTEIPVVFDGVKYQKVSGIIYRKGQKGILLQAELWNNHSVTIANPKKVQSVENISNDTIVEITDLEKAINFFRERIELTQDMFSQQGQIVFYKLALNALEHQQANTMFEYETL